VTSEPAFYVGLLLVLTGVACVVVAIALGRPYAIVGLAGIPFAVAGGLLVQNAWERATFRVTELSIGPITDYAGPCPGTHRVGIRVDTAGGAGEVAFRVWARDEDLDAPPATIRVQPDRGFEYLSRVSVAEPGYAVAYAVVESPNHKAASGVFTVRCTPAE